MGSKRLTGILATAVAILTAAVAGTALYTSVQISEAERSARTALQDAAAYAQSLDELKEAVSDAEAAQRGYLLTGDPDYLEPYETALTFLESNLETEDYLALQNDDADVLRQTVELKLAELRETIRLFDNGGSRAALRVVQTDRGLEWMTEIRRIVADRQALAEGEAAAAADRAELYERRAGQVSAMLAAVLGLAVMTGLFTIYQGFRARRAETEAEEATETAEKIEIIAHELDHRMKNMFAVAQGMLRQSARGRGDDVERFAGEAVDRLQAMSQAYSSTSELQETRSLPATTIIDRVVRAQILDHHKLEVAGEEGTIAETAVTPFSLILHEWTTNALKYGAWKPDGSGSSKVRFTWRSEQDGTHQFVWEEEHGARETLQPDTSGYGSKLIKACAAQLGGTVEYDWHSTGVRIHLKTDADKLGFQTRNAVPS